MVENKLKTLRPKSSVPALSGYIAIFFLIVGFHYWPQGLTEVDSNKSAIFFLCYLFILVAAYEIIFVKIYNAEDSGLNFKKRRPLTCLLENKDFLLKLVGLVVPYVVVLCGYWQFEIYRTDFYDPFYDLLKNYGFYIVLGLLIYFPVLHLYMVDPNDSYWAMGLYICSFGKRGDVEVVRRHALSVAIKAFFTPMMFCFFLSNWEYLNGNRLILDQGFQPIYDYLLRYLFFIDLAVAVVGYTFTSRIVNSHVRWPETTAGGWIFCLMCYTPFWTIVGQNYINYTQGNHDWVEVFSGYDTLYMVWGYIILALMAVFSLATANFGIRFSNMTHRGIITHGLYRFTKHPAYLSKNLSWWFMSLPFIAISPYLAFSNCVALLMANYIYYKRAKYEEACLSQDITYRNYMEYIAENGLFAHFFKMLGKKVKKNQ